MFWQNIVNGWNIIGRYFPFNARQMEILFRPRLSFEGEKRKTPLPWKNYLALINSIDTL